MKPDNPDAAVGPSTTAVCPATMCPLFAAEGSPWTGEKNAACPNRGVRFDADDEIIRNDGCMWWHDANEHAPSGCGGCVAAHNQIAQAADGKFVLQLGPGAKRHDARAPRDYDCPRASECQWQIEAESEGGICPPRTALRLGLDPRLSAY